MTAIDAREIFKALGLSGGKRPHQSENEYQSGHRSIDSDSTVELVSAPVHGDRRDALISALEQPPRDHLRLDLRRAFENIENARVA